MGIFRWVLILMALGLLAYIRFAPPNSDRWHQIPKSTGPGDYAGVGDFRAERRITAPSSEVLAAVEQRALATPRTRLVAGSAEAGMMTFETRSLIMGFPDYTTVTVQDDILVIHGRLRFGKSDMGVNRTRVIGWLTMLGPLTEPL